MLWDNQTYSIVNNESAEIIEILNSEFNDYATHPDLDLAPKKPPRRDRRVERCHLPDSQQWCLSLRFCPDTDCLRSSLYRTICHTRSR